MPHIPEGTDPEDWHRYFAIECNNRAWELAVQPRSEERDREMLNCAHASALHWNVAGTELNDMRARTLLAEVHALLGFGSSALVYADQVRAFFLDKDPADWELAFIHTIHAHAAYVAGRSDLHVSSYEEAVRAIEAIADDEDRKIVLETFNLLAKP
ncbi:MAG: hypothetical protein O7E57_15495 [Gammaproteobacteria bacterium]|nr:hypothetical protein [Gammaproteobacteria bacterium]